MRFSICRVVVCRMYADLDARIFPPLDIFCNFAFCCSVNVVRISEMQMTTLRLAYWMMDV